MYKCAYHLRLHSLYLLYVYYSMHRPTHGGALRYNNHHRNRHPRSGDAAQKECGMEGNASFGYWIRRRRKALDLTQDELARQVGCALSTIRKIEADERRPSRQVAERLA